MVLTFFKKNKDFYEKFNKKDGFVCYSNNETIAQYTIADTIDSPVVGEMIRVEDNIYKVFSTIVNYEKKEMSVVVEEF